MFQLSIMFVAGEIKQKPLRKFSEVFFNPPFISNICLLFILYCLEITLTFFLPPGVFRLLGVPQNIVLIESSLKNIHPCFFKKSYNLLSIGLRTNS